MNQTVTILKAEQIDKLKRTTEHGLSSFIETIEKDMPIDGTKTKGFLHILNRETNGKIRSGDLAEFISQMIVDYAIPRSEFKKAEAMNAKHNTTKYTLELQTKARGLFVNAQRTGEAGEVLLYLMIQEFLSAPQFLCKMSLKTDTQLHFNGIDGIHISHAKDADGNDIPVFYWGESKVHKSLSNAIKDSVSSLKDFLSKDAPSASKERELQLMRDNIDLEDEDLEDAILRYLDKDSPLYNKVIYKGACLVGFDHEKYETLDHEMLKSHFKSELEDWTEKLKSALKDSELLEAEIHVFFLPFPSVDEFREAFLKVLRTN